VRANVFVERLRPVLVVRLRPVCLCLSACILYIVCACVLSVLAPSSACPPPCTLLAMSLCLLSRLSLDHHSTATRPLPLPHIVGVLCNHLIQRHAHRLPAWRPSSAVYYFGCHTLFNNLITVCVCVCVCVWFWGAAHDGRGLQEDVGGLQSQCNAWKTLQQSPNKLSLPTCRPPVGRRPLRPRSSAKLAGAKRDSCVWQLLFSSH